MLGNKALLEARIKSASSGLNFADKRKYYTGQASTRRTKTQINELLEIAKAKSSFNAKDISQRNKKIIDSFITFMTDCQLTK